MLRYNAVIIFKLVLRVPLSLSLWINCSWFIFGYWILNSALFRNPIVTLQAKLGFPCYLYKIYPSKAAGDQQSCWRKAMLLETNNAAADKQCCCRKVMLLELSNAAGDKQCCWRRFCHKYYFFGNIDYAGETFAILVTDIQQWQFIEIIS